jgi:hypothetical protein
MKVTADTIGLRCGLVLLALLAPGPLVAAGAPPDPAARTSQPDEPLDEVLVEGNRIRQKSPSWDDYQQPFNLLARLVGTFTVAGTVDHKAQGRNEDLAGPAADQLHHSQQSRHKARLLHAAGDRRGAAQQ